MQASAVENQDGQAGIADRRGESGQARVRRVLIAPLVEDGLVRPRGVTVEAQAALCDKLADRLAYLDEALLVVLRETVLRLAEGPLRNQWPAFATIWNMAVRLQTPPDAELPIMTSWLTSVEGPRARAGGYLVELRAWLRRHGVPPGSYDITKIRQQAEENRRRLDRLRDVAALGRCNQDDLDWMDGYTRALARCEALVAEGDAKRAAAAGGRA